MSFEEKAKAHNLEYIEQTDIRVKKPHVFFHQENPNLKIVLSNNWVLESDKLETMIDTPNDVAIYSSISISNLEKAKEFHKKEIIPRQQSGFGSKTITKPLITEYYDYFEKTITAIIFAYTSIEAFANICIPNDYTYSYTDKQGEVIVRTKEEIERTATLREKLKIFLPEIIGCTSPTNRKWWTKFTELENLRNEIIHSKESKSEERYSKLLSSSIIRKVEVHKEVIEFFGTEIAVNKVELIDEYPNGFQHDYYKVKKMTHENFKRSIKVIKE
jgi:hypothetical protein